MKKTLLRAIACLMFVVAIAAGMTVAYQKNASAASQITVKWIGNGGKNSQGQTSHYTYYYNKTMVSLKPSSTIYKRSGYTLTGFSVNGTFYSVGSSIMITRDVTITCQWRPNYVTVSFSGGLGRTKSSITVPYGTTVGAAVSKGGIPAASIGCHRKYNENSLSGSVLYENTKITKSMTIVINSEPNSGLLNIRNFDGKGSVRSYTVQSGKSLTNYVSTLSWHVPQLQDSYLYALKDDSGNMYYTGAENFAPLLCLKNQGDSIWLTACWAPPGKPIDVSFYLDRSTVDYLYSNYKTSTGEIIYNKLLEILCSEAASIIGPKAHALAILIQLIPSDIDTLTVNISQWHDYLVHNGYSSFKVSGYLIIDELCGDPEFHITNWGQ